MTATICNVYDYLTTSNMKPTLRVLDNKYANKTKPFFQKQNTTIQFVDPNQHCVNAAERAIQTFKDHFIAELCTVDKSFPLQVWSDLLQQAELTINLLCTSRINTNFLHTPSLKPIQL